MMKRIRQIAAAVIFLFGVVACTTEEQNTTASYTGRVVELSSNLPFSGIPVRVTNGDNTHTQTITNTEGVFNFSIVIKEIDASYYVEIGDDTCLKKQVDIPGFATGTTDMGTIAIQGPDLPSIRLTGSRIDDSILTINANISDNGRLPILDRGICYGKNQSPTIDDNIVSCGNEEGTFQGKVNLKSLDRNSTYYFRVYAKNKKGVSYDGSITNTTDSGLPVINSDPTKTFATSITATSASIVSQIYSDGGYTIKEVGVCWDTNGYPSIDGNHFSKAFGNYYLGFDLTGLSPSTTYYFRVYAKNEIGIGYSSVMSFKTKTGAATAKSTKISVYQNLLICYGTATKGASDIKRRGFCVSTNSSPSLSDRVAVASTAGNGDYSVTINDLEQGTLYYAKAFAEDDNGVSYGDVLYDRTQVKVTFNVKNNEGKGITKARVYIRDSDSGYTDSNGIYSLFEDVGTYRIRVSAEGYLSTDYHDIYVSKNQYAFNYTLEKE